MLEETELYNIGVLRSCWLKMFEVDLFVECGNGNRLIIINHC